MAKHEVFYIFDRSIIDNTFTNNGIGITVGGVTNPTLIYHNCFINNNERARGLGVDTLFWDDGYPSGGNYWGGFVSQTCIAVNIRTLLKGMESETIPSSFQYSVLGIDIDSCSWV